MATDFVETVAGAIVGQLRQGTAPWTRPWAPGQHFLPYNPTTGNTYRGINSLWLLATSQERGYGDSRWLTWRQAWEQGGQVRRGERGTTIQYWKWQGLEPAIGADGRPLLDENGARRQELVHYQRPRVWLATIFNAAQIDGLPAEPERSVLPDWQRHAQAERLLAAGSPDIRHQPGDRAFYSPVPDIIVLPERAQFATADGYYATALHEKGHWTGHASRLGRNLAHPFGSAGYAREELRAEIASMVLGEQLGIGHDPNRHAAYIGSWIRALEDDPREIFRAAGDAEKIVRHLRGLEQEHEQGLERPAARSPDGNIAQGRMPVPVLVRETEAAMRTGNGRVYLAVPYAEKDAAHSLGARWDHQARTWFAPPGTDLTPLEKWLPDRAKLHVEVGRDPRAEFADALREAGLRLEGQAEMDGQLRRVRVEGDRPGERSGAYVGFMDGHPAGYIRNYLTGIEQTWKSHLPARAAGPEDRARLAAEAAQRRQDRLLERERMYEVAAEVAETRLSAAVPAPAGHPYLAAKDVPPDGLRQDAAGNLLVPLRDATGRLWSTQAIGSDGRKSFQKDGRVHGCHYLIGDPAAGSAILVAEGYATGATVHRATGQPVAVAFNAGNLAAVAEALRERYPDKPILIAGDNDHVKERQGRPNVGRDKAEEAAQRVAGFALLPRFGAHERGSDWNDLARSQGLEAVRGQLEAGMARAERHRLAGEFRQARSAEVPFQDERREVRKLVLAEPDSTRQRTRSRRSGHS
jgi:putative DNA primase/helicase